MGLGPVQPGSAEIEPPTFEKRVRAATLPASPDSGKTPKISSTEDSVAQSLFPEHEVKVQEDTPPDNILIYQVLDKQTGAVVLQVPSTEVLNDVHQSQELLERIGARGKASASSAASVPSAKGEGRINGNKL
jgi:hypothetical protein